ncbi:uncharacterized protein Dvir_GJ19082, isoform B [Drosophila virilis]|uniref:RING-type E3 ubiquitin transferase n=1 Tax=Drosophila virilis TaxID=7244 RepID=A0A0Q9WBL1_DROVI|nr:uncharacterized protein Dvir_GJ19082, isoform B [Drosophila virilis]
MGNLVSRQNAAVEEADHITNNAYKYPPRIGNFFGTHFIMGGERFDTPQPESYLFGENADLNFLGNRPTAFPYPPPQANEPTKTLKSLVNIRKESVRFVRVPYDKRPSCAEADTVQENEKNKTLKEANGSASGEQIDGNVLCNMVGVSSGAETVLPNYFYNIEFIFDSDAKCAITVYYVCTEDVSPSGVTLAPREGLSLSSDTYHYDKGINQFFSQPNHVFNPQLIPEDDLTYNASREQYPVAIHCVIEEGNEECRQSHTTICVIDHHPETCSYVLRALKQKIFVDGLCYLLQEIYGIENKAVNKTSLDEEIDDHGSECVICMSETRDTLILPCRHLCLCNSCADSLRYQANNCPICRAPFRALLQIRAVQKGISTHMLHQNTPTSVAGEPTPPDVPPGYIPVSLIEALNGPPQYVTRARKGDNDSSENIMMAASTMTSDDIKATSPLKSSSQRRPKIKKHVSTCTTTNEKDNTGVLDDDEDSKNEKLSPLLSSGMKIKNTSGKSLKLVVDTLGDSDGEDIVKNIQVNDAAVTVSIGGECNDLQESNSEKISSLKHDRHRTESADCDAPARDPCLLVANFSAEDSDYYTPDDTQNTILSPLYPSDRAKRGDPLSCSCVVLNQDMNIPNASALGYSTMVKGSQSLQKKSTSAGNIVGPTNEASPYCGVDLKSNNVSSLPDMLDSPISGNSASTRSSSDSYSSSSSTKQLLSFNTTTTAANIIVDDKTAAQNAVNV